MNPSDGTTPNPRLPLPQTRSQLSTSKSKLICFWAAAVLILLLSISFNFTNSTPLLPAIFRRLRSVLLPPNQPLKPFRALLGFLAARRRSHRRPTSARPPCVLWMAPFLSGGGYSSEAWSYIAAMYESARGSSIRIKIEQHGDLENVEFWNGLPTDLKDLGYKLHDTECPMAETTVICHSEPGAWYPPLFQTLPCPPTGYGEPKVVVGRTMFETDRLNAEHARRCNRMDYVWVPTEFHLSTFAQSGVNSSKLVKMVQPVDVKFFDPTKHKPLELPCTKPIFGDGDANSCTKSFVFLSIFKWEFRKGWDVLLKAYLKEFNRKDGVVLYMLTNPYHSDKDFGTKIRQFVIKSGLDEPVEGWAPVHVIDTHVAQSELPRLYKAANAFVLPSRGEGWGRPIVEAMAMALPVIVTNWSGPTEYLTQENSYPLLLNQMSEVKEGPFKGHSWAEPSVTELRHLMRHVASNPEEASGRGRNARNDMIRRFSPEVIAELVIDQILRISGTNSN